MIRAEIQNEPQNCTELNILSKMSFKQPEIVKSKYLPELFKNEMGRRVERQLYYFYMGGWVI